jgi:hypothetical protein
LLEASSNGTSEVAIGEVAHDPTLSTRVPPPWSPEFDELVKEWQATLQYTSDQEEAFLKALNDQLPGEQERGTAYITQFPPGDGKGINITKLGGKRFPGCNDTFKQKIAEIAVCNPGSEKRSLVILEDLGMKWIDVLATTLRVPLHVFAQHWADPLSHIDGTVRVPLGQDPHYEMVLNYDQLHPVVLIKTRTTRLTEVGLSLYRVDVCNRN